MKKSATALSDAAPPLERYSAEKFRQWLAGMVSEDQVPTTTDRDEMAQSIIQFLGAVPHVFELDRLTMWDKIGNASSAALETSDGDLMKWANRVLEAVGAQPGRVASCEPLTRALATLQIRDDWWRAECLRVIRDLRYTLPTFAREQWQAHKAAAEADRSNKHG